MGSVRQWTLLSEYLENDMKFNRNFWIPFSIVGFLSITFALTGIYPFSVIALMFLFFLSLLLVANKLCFDWGRMFVYSLPISILFFLVIVGLFVLSKDHPLLKSILFWPLSG